MANRVQQLLCALALTGLAAGALAQTSASPEATGGAPNVPGGATGEHRMHDRQDGGRGGERRFDERDGHDSWGEHGGEGRHRHHHHHHHHHWGHRHQGWGYGPQAMHRPGGRMMEGLPLLRSFHALNLTAAQHQQVQDLLRKAREQVAAKRPAGPPADRLALANPGDPGYASAVQAAKKRATDRIQQRSDLNQQLYGVLTADQKTQLSKMLATWKARMAERNSGPRGPLDSVNR